MARPHQSLRREFASPPPRHDTIASADPSPPQAADTGGDIPLSRCLASATADTAAADAAIFKLLIEKGASMEVRHGRVRRTTFKP